MGDGGRPAGAPNAGDVYVAGNNAVSVIDPNNNTIVSTIPFAHDPFAIAVSPTGANAGDVYVVNYGFGTVTVIDPTTNTILTRIPVGSLPEAVAVGSP